MKLDPHLSTCIKKESNNEWMDDLNIRGETDTTRENYRGNAPMHRHSENFPKRIAIPTIEDHLQN